MTMPCGPTGTGMVLMTWFVPVSSTATALSLNNPTYALTGATEAALWAAAGRPAALVVLPFEQAAATTAVTAASATSTSEERRAGCGARLVFDPEIMRGRPLSHRCRVCVAER